MSSLRSIAFVTLVAGLLAGCDGFSQDKDETDTAVDQADKAGQADKVDQADKAGQAADKAGQADKVDQADKAGQAADKADQTDTPPKEENYVQSTAASCATFECQATDYGDTTTPCCMTEEECNTDCNALADAYKKELADAYKNKAFLDFAPYNALLKAYPDYDFCANTAGGCAAGTAGGCAVSCAGGHKKNTVVVSDGGLWDDIGSVSLDLSGGIDGDDISISNDDWVKTDAKGF